MREGTPLAYKNTHKEQMAKIILNGEKLGSFSLSSGEGQDILSHHSYSTSWFEVLAGTIRKEKTKQNKNGKKCHTA